MQLQAPPEVDCAPALANSISPNNKMPQKPSRLPSKKKNPKLLRLHVVICAVLLKCAFVGLRSLTVAPLLFEVFGFSEKAKVFLISSEQAGREACVLLLFLLLLAFLGRTLIPEEHVAALHQ